MACRVALSAPSPKPTVWIVMLFAAATLASSSGSGASPSSCPSLRRMTIRSPALSPLRSWTTFARCSPVALAVPPPVTRSSMLPLRPELLKSLVMYSPSGVVT
jgi:hypothetical protein